MSECQPPSGAHENFATLVSRYGENPTQEGFDAIHRKYLADCERTRLEVGPAYGSHGSAAAMFDVIAERLRQQEKEGWTPEHDDQHVDGELAQAAAVYAHPFDIKLAMRRSEYDRGKNAWPWYDQVDVSGGRGEFPVWGWEPAWLKKTERRRDLVKAAALIIAEIERIDRAALATPEGSSNA